MRILKLCSDLLHPKRRWHSAAALCFALAVPLYAEPAYGPDILSGALVGRADSAFSLGYIEDAVRMLDEALALAPASSDANYARALTGLSAGENFALAEERLLKAMASDTFRRYSRLDARILYAAVCMYTLRPEDALTYIHGLTESGELLFIRARALLALGKKKAAAETVTEALLRYPYDPRALLAWLAYNPSPAAQYDYAVTRLIDTAWKSLPKLKEIDPHILVALAPYAFSDNDSRFMLREYRAVGNSSPLATALALHYGLIDERSAARELFSGSYTPDYASLERVYALLASDDARRAFAEEFAAYTGSIRNDSNHDGYPEDVCSFVDGTLSGWVCDADQNGIPEIEADFYEAVPRRIRFRAGPANPQGDDNPIGAQYVAIRYDVWPAVSHITYSAAGKAREYMLGPGVLEAPVLRLAKLSGTYKTPYRVRKDTAPPLESFVSGIAFAVRAGSDTAELYGGQAWRSWSYEPKGSARYTEYQNGFPSYERIDADGDSRYESVKVWRRGTDGLFKLAYIESDIDGDGIYEFRQTGEGYQSWDYDQDGSPDMIYRASSDGSEYYSYTLREGTLTEVVFKNGMLTSVTKNGRALPLVQDSGGLVTWLGEKPFDLGSAAPGRWVKNGIMYAVFSMRGKLYAETVE